jgi:hypothetical protein
MSYYYLISSLPGLALEMPPAISMDEFRSNCADQLSARDSQALEHLLNMDADSARHPFVKHWINCETQLRNAAARLRAGRQNSNAIDFIHDHDGFQNQIENSVKSAFETNTPLERERLLDELRWSLLDDLAGPYPFSTNIIFAYAVKLQIAARWAAMDKNIGENKIRKSIENSNNNSRAATNTDDSGAQ